MAILKFRIYWEEDESIYRDIAVQHSQTFAELHTCILKSFEFDSKHKATFYRSNDNWARGREISLEKYNEVQYKVEPLLMGETILGSEIKDPNQKFVYVYDFNKVWNFKVELIHVEKEEDKKQTYPCCVRVEGIAPSQYGTKGMVDSRLAEMEEKYDLSATSMMEGYSEEGEDIAASEGLETNDTVTDEF